MSVLVVAEYMQCRELNITCFMFQKRHVLEENNQLESRVSALDEDLEDMESDEEEPMVSSQLTNHNTPHNTL